MSLDDRQIILGALNKIIIKLDCHYLASMATHRKAPKLYSMLEINKNGKGEITSGRL